MTAICQRLSAHGGTALAIDYGHLVAGFGDTLQAMRNHAFDPPLAHPGEADLTSHVDFESLVKTAQATGVHINGTLRQGDFLYGLGLKERASALAAKATPDQTLDIAEAVNRLAGEGAGKMGTFSRSSPFQVPRFISCRFARWIDSAITSGPTSPRHTKQAHCITHAAQRRSNRKHLA